MNAPVRPLQQPGTESVPSGIALPAQPIVMIPARMASTRLPNKPLADINGLPMIVHVMKRAEEAKLGRVVIACAEEEIKAAVEKAGGEAVLTDPGLPSGSDRILAALQTVDPQGRHDAVINVQGDLPTLDAALVKTAFSLLLNPETDIATLGAIITKPAEATNPNVVKAVAEIDFAKGERYGRALYFTRATAPAGDGPLLHHIGLYAYKRAALEKFVASPPAVLEKRERLEQLRALALGMRIDIAVADTVPLGVDTPEDLETAREALK
ncbi:MAG: 3-deoxy-manno-octulosonate cytidylyltransferase [Alphaproteobacteria bacterium]|nr:3-deoxy-manno-octulosonate cytidylyltransferase [Alphaproteobacteria bacterium]